MPIEENPSTASAPAAAKKPIPAYRSRLKAERSDELFVEIMTSLTQQKLYRDPTFTAKKLATILHTNTRYISSAIANNTAGNYNTLINTLRLRDACAMLRSRRFLHHSIEEIGLLAGFANRQSFYKCFVTTMATTPNAYRMQYIPEAGQRVHKN